MSFEITNEDHILTITGRVPEEADRQSSRFGTEEELHRLAGAWPMKRLVEIWNRLPGVSPVQKFENRQIAIAFDPPLHSSRETPPSVPRGPCILEKSIGW